MEMNKGYLAITVFLSFIGLYAVAQVPVREEPRHKPVLVNQYFRMLDVKIPPGDTTLYHIHETPSLFLRFTNSYVASQVKDSVWSEKSMSIKGTADYDYFSNTRVHRVSNQDKDTFHVTDIEILSGYHPGSNIKPLPFTVLFENERSFAYRITEIENSKIVIQDRGPIIAALVDGNSVAIHEHGTKLSTEIMPGKFAYLKPGGSYYFSTGTKEKINLVLFELK